MGETNLKKITSSAYMKSLGDRKTLDKSEIKILKSKFREWYPEVLQKKTIREEEKKNYI